MGDRYCQPPIPLYFSQRTEALNILYKEEHLYLFFGGNKLRFFSQRTTDTRVYLILTILFRSGTEVRTFLSIFCYSFVISCTMYILSQRLIINRISKKQCSNKIIQWEILNPASSHSWKETGINKTNNRLLLLSQEKDSLGLFKLYFSNLFTTSDNCTAQTRIIVEHVVYTSLMNHT